MTQLAVKLRACSLVIALVLPLAGMRGVCFMSSKLPDAARSEHDCCKTGLKLARPNCCMAVSWEQAPARTAPRSSVDITAVSVWALAQIDSTMTRSRPTDRPRKHDHGAPEHIVLRI